MCLQDKIYQFTFNNQTQHSTFTFNSTTNPISKIKMVSKVMLICVLLISVGFIMEAQAGDKGRSNIVLQGGNGDKLVLQTGKKGKGANIVSKDGFGGEIVLSTDRRR